jgi:type VI secretion system protein ImpM
MMSGFGAFGKIPSLGDFFTYNLDQVMVENWDNWIQKYMISLKSRLGIRWDKCFMTAPIWRFSLSAGVVSDSFTYGVMMPSIDRVGRQFPMTIAATRSDVNSVLYEHNSSYLLFEKLEDLALLSLEETTSKDLFLQSLEAIDKEKNRPTQKLVNFEKTFFNCDGDINSFNEELASMYVCSKMKLPCIWSSVTTGGVKFFFSDGLPNSDDMEALYDLESSKWTRS